MFLTVYLLCARWGSIGSIQSGVFVGFFVGFFVSQLGSQPTPDGRKKVGRYIHTCRSCSFGYCRYCKTARWDGWAGRLLTCLPESTPRITKKVRLNGVNGVRLRKISNLLKLSLRLTTFLLVWISYLPAMLRCTRLLPW